MSYQTPMCLPLSRYSGLNSRMYHYAPSRCPTKTMNPTLTDGYQTLTGHCRSPMYPIRWYHPAMKNCFLTCWIGPVPPWWLLLPAARPS